VGQEGVALCSNGSIAAHFTQSTGTSPVTASNAAVVVVASEAKNLSDIPYQTNRLLNSSRDSIASLMLL